MMPQALDSGLVDENARLKAQVAELLAERDARKLFIEELIGVVGHDLRSPLSAIVMASALLAKAPLDDRGTRALRRIHSSSRRAERLIKDLVDFARLRLGRAMELQRGSADLHEIARLVVIEMQLAHPQRNVQLTVEGDARGLWDAERLAQLVAALLESAIKGSAPSSDVRVAIAADDAEVRLLVTNQGPPIDAIASLTRPFDPLVRADGKSGWLGLVVAAEIVRAHGGAVEVRCGANDTTTIAHLPR